MPAPAGNKDTKWADGLRGIASLLVVTAHITRSLAPYILNPQMGDDMPPVLLQLPFLRCFVMGRASVAAFAVLSGFVNALGPTKKTRSGQIDAALSGIAKAAFRRTGRFMIPSIIATTLSWFACQLGAYRLAKTVASNWIRDTSPSISASFGDAFIDLARSLIKTWTDGGNAYDRIQWTLCYLLKGSMLCYLTLFATAYVVPMYRFMFYGILYAYFFRLGDAVVGFNIFFGLLLAEATFEPAVQEFAQRHNILRRICSVLLIIVGLFVISYPEEHPEWAAWSRAMTTVAGYLFKPGGEVSRFYAAIGAEMICLGVMFNNTAKRLLSTSWPCFLGRVSFAIYLIHAPLIRIVLCWMLYGYSERPESGGVGEDGKELGRPWVPLTSKWAAALAIPLFYAILYRLAAYWVAYVDPFCGKVTDWVEQRVFRRENPTLSEKVAILV